MEIIIDKQITENYSFYTPKHDLLSYSYADSKNKVTSIYFAKLKKQDNFIIPAPYTHIKSSLSVKSSIDMLKRIKFLKPVDIQLFINNEMCLDLDKKKLIIDDLQIVAYQQTIIKKIQNVDVNLEKIQALELLKEKLTKCSDNNLLINMSIDKFKQAQNILNELSK